LRLALKSRERLRILGNIWGQKLESDKTVQPSVFGFVDHAHSTAADFLEDVIVGNGLAQQRMGVGHYALILGCRQRQVNERGRIR
jgi:hypothetical protein